MRRYLFGFLCVCALGAVLSLPALAHESDDKLGYPGFRPYSEYASAFLNTLDTATIAVHPTVVRKADRTSHSFASQKQIIALIRKHEMAAAAAGSGRVDLGKLEATSQWDLFLNDMQRIAETLKGQTSAADYHLFMELVWPVNVQPIFGIHCYVFDRQGQNAFSFLLNSHHQLFADAKLIARSASEAARDRLVKKATDVGVTAFEAQVAQARKSLPRAADTGSTRVEAGVFDDFESGLPSEKDEFGIPIGFVTFTDGSSAIGISTTTTHPPLSDQAAGKSALKLDFDVTGWAAFAHIFENDTADQWTSYDWTGFNEFSFWLYGRNSGNSLFVDILDNRKPSSTVDDAERYVYVFTDDFSGWKQVIIRFADMRRKKGGNGPPVDGLGLSEVHGWAFGTTNTGGPITYYLDNFELRNAPACSADYPINELPMYGHIQKTADQKRADTRYIKEMTTGGRSREAAAVVAARLGWHIFYQGDCSTAIKRFNQAWLLDPKNQLALWGFAVISIDRAQVEEAIRYYRMAIESGPEDPSLRRDYENALKRLEH
ncbi:MAG: hypothetical protein OEN21_14695 [Myxococcales bacterium]|nr:hypothetical protein [Myxococcales bacterium]